MTRFHTVRLWTARAADLVAAAVLFALVGYAMLGGSRPFREEMLWLGMAGSAICVVQPNVQRNLPIALTLFTLLTLLSAYINFKPSSGSQLWFDAARPATTMLVFVFGAAHLLRTPRRLSMLAIGLVVAISILGAQITFDRLRTAFIYERIGSSSIPLVAQWGSLHQTGMLIAIAVPFSMALALAERSLLSIAAGGVLTAGLFAFGLVNGSRTGVLAMGFAGVVMVVAAVRDEFFRQRRSLVVGGVSLLVSLGLVYLVFFNKTSMPLVKSLTGDRLPIWMAAARIAWDHPLIGVGPGRYSEAMVYHGYAYAYLPWLGYSGGGLDQAHNLILHTAAETGFIGAALMIAVWLSAILWCRRAWGSGVIPLLAFAYFGALATFFARVQADDFLDNLVTVDRTRVLVGALLGAALAVQRLSRSEATR